MNALVSQRSSQSITPDPKTAAILADAHSRLLGDDLVGGLSIESKSKLVARQQRLHAALAPASLDDYETPIATLLASFFLARNVSPVEAQVTVRAYAMAMNGLPLWIVKQACERVAQGLVEGLGLDFPPSAPRLRTVAAELMEPHAAETYQLNRVLTAKPFIDPSPEEKERVGRKFAELKARMNGLGLNEMPKAQPLKASDGRHAARVADDLAQRRIRKETLGDPPSEESAA